MGPLIIEWANIFFTNSEISALCALREFWSPVYAKIEILFRICSQCCFRSIDQQSSEIFFHYFCNLSLFHNFWNLSLMCIAGILIIRICQNWKFCFASAANAVSCPLINNRPIGNLGRNVKLREDEMLIFVLGQVCSFCEDGKNHSGKV